MKTILATLLITVTVTLGFSQEKTYFNGMIKHKHVYKSNTLNVDSLSKKKSFGDTYYFYKNIYKGTTFVDENQLTYIYDANKNECLYYNYAKSTISCSNYSVNKGDTLINSYKVAKTYKINGFDCELIVLEYPTVTYKEYVTDGFYIDPKIYKNHHSYDYSTKMAKTNGRLAIRTEIVMTDYTMIIDLIDYEESAELLTDLTSFDKWWKVCGANTETAE